MLTFVGRPGIRTVNAVISFRQGRESLALTEALYGYYKAQVSLEKLGWDSKSFAGDPCIEDGLPQRFDSVVLTRQLVVAAVHESLQYLSDNCHTDVVFSYSFSSIQHKVEINGETPSASRELLGLLMDDANQLER